MTRTLKWARFVIAGMLAMCLLILAGTILLTLGAKTTGRDTLVIRGGSMQPAIPLGAVVVTQPVDPAAIAVGDVISIHAISGVVYTHRVIAIDELAGAVAFQTQGDANATPDPALVPAGAVMGRVVFTVPLLGYLLALLGTPIGIASLGCALISLLLSYWLFEDIELEQRELGEGRGERTKAPVAQHAVIGG